MIGISHEDGSVDLVGQSSGHYDVTDERLTDAELFCKLVLEKTATLIQSDNLTLLFRSQFCRRIQQFGVASRAVPFTGCDSLFQVAIKHVVDERAERQMSESGECSTPDDIDARVIITNTERCITDVKDYPSRWNWLAARQFVSKSMSGLHRPFDHDCAIRSIATQNTGPKPARPPLRTPCRGWSVPVDLLPKSRDWVKCWSQSSAPVFVMARG